MPRPRFDRLQADKKSRILRVAAREFAAHGFERASLNRILEGAGVSKGAAYYYFDDKADLFATVIDYYLDNTLLDREEAVFEGASARTFWMRIRDLTRYSFARAREEPWLFGLAKALWKLPPDWRSRGPLARPFERGRAWLVSVLARGQRLGVVRDDLPEDFLVAAVLALDEAADRWLADHWEQIAETGIEQNVDLYVDLLKRVLQPARRSRSKP